MDKIAVLIPCYNESATIKKVVEDFQRVLPEAVIYVYDNNSTDHTDRIAREAGAVVRYVFSQGKGNVIRAMFREVHAQCYLMADGDDTYPPEQARALTELVLNKGVHMAIGDRLSSTYFTENKRPFHNFGNVMVRSLIRLLFHDDVKDIMTGYRAFSFEFVKTFPVLSKGFEIETEMTIHALDKNLKPEPVVISYRDRPAGSVSKLNTYSDGLRVLKTIVRLFKNYRPFFFFGLLGCLFLLLSAVLFLPVLLAYSRTGLVDRFPTLIVSGFLGVAALISWFGGLQLSVTLEQGRRDFEYKFNCMHLERERLEALPPAPMPFAQSGIQTPEPKSPASGQPGTAAQPSGGEASNPPSFRSKEGKHDKAHR